MNKLLLTLLILLTFSTIINAEELTEMTTKPTTVSLFKNGLGYFIREGEIPLKTGWVQARPLPVPVLGTFLLTTEKGLSEVIATKMTVTENVEAINMMEILRANIGKEVELTTYETTLKGIILSVPENRITEPISPNIYGSYPTIIPSELIFLRTAKKTIALAPSRIIQIDFPEDKMNSNYSKTKEATRLKLHFENAPVKAPVRISYLQKGITWIPSYVIDIEDEKDEKKAKITMTARVINEIEDLENVEMNFVTGFPHFMFSEVISPLSLQTDLTSFLASLNGGTGNYDYGVFGQRRSEISFNYMANVNMDMWEAYDTQEIAGSYQEDLFFYKQENITLKKGECGYYTLLATKTVPYRHIYEWKIADTIDDDYNYYDEYNTQSSKEEIWHSIELENQTNIPWTTASATTVKGDNILGQDILNYTPVKGKNNVKITRSTDIKAERNEYEIKREENNKKIRGYYYDLITVKGELKVTNYKSDDITLNITKHLTGSVISKSDDGEMKLVAEGLKAINSNSVLEWEIELKAGKNKTIIYQYQVYIQH